MLVKGLVEMRSFNRHASLPFPQNGVEARYIGDIGYGLFAEKDFEPGDCICLLGLENTTRSRIISWEDSFGEYFDRSFTITPGFAWCATPTHPFWYINHSCDPKCGFVNWGRAVHGNIPIVAHRPIARGQQITMDYALFTASYDGDLSGGPWKMTNCLCHSAHCRGVIAGFHRLPSDLQWQAVSLGGEVQGLVPAHMVMEVPDLVSRLRQASPALYQSYLEALRQQMALSSNYAALMSGKAQRAHRLPRRAIPIGWPSAEVD